MQISVLGPIRVFRDGLELPLPTMQMRRLLTLLAAWPREVLETERLMAGLWGDDVTTSSRNTLQVHVSHLRKTIGMDLIHSEAGGYRLDVDPQNIDANAVFGLVHRAGVAARAGRFAAAHEAYAQALGLFRGQAFSGTEDVDIVARRAELEELHALAEEERLACAIELSVDRQHLGEPIATARTLVRRHPERERRWELLIRGLAAADRLGEASQTFDDARIFLRESAGLDPGDALRWVIERALRRDPGLHPALWSRPDNIPAGESPREHHVRVQEASAAARRQLENDRCVRLWMVAPAEINWSLALALAREFRGDFREGIHLDTSQTHDQPAARTDEYLVITVGPRERVLDYVQSRVGETFTSPSIVAVCDQPPGDGWSVMDVVRVASR